MIEEERKKENVWLDNLGIYVDTIERYAKESKPKARRQKFSHNLSILRPHDRRGEEEGKYMTRVT